MEKETLVGMGADEINTTARLEAFGHNVTKQRNSRQRYRYTRLVRYELSKQRRINQLRSMIQQVYSYIHRN